MALVQKTLTVIGGNGFLGKRICQAAVLRGFNVVSLSRSGKPPLLITRADDDWISKIHWDKLDVFDPKSYTKQLAKTDVLVHTLGILLESNYKSNLNKNATVCDILNNMKENVMPNPMTRTMNNSYDNVNRQTAILAASNYIKASKKTKEPKFVYISADKGFPGLPSGYINSKRAAELELLDMSNTNKNFSTLIVRPGFMYDEEINGDLRSNFNSLLQALNKVNNIALNGLLGGLIRPTISTQTVAQKIIKGIEDDKNGILLLEQLLN